MSDLGIAIGSLCLGLHTEVIARIDACFDGRDRPGKLKLLVLNP